MFPPRFSLKSSWNFLRQRIFRQMPTKEMDPNLLITQLNSNHEKLVAKITEMEASVARIRAARTSVSSSKNISNRGDDNSDERQRLTAENQQLRAEIQRLIQRLTQLETASTGVAPPKIPEPMKVEPPQPAEKQEPKPAAAATPVPAATESKPANKKDKKKQQQPAAAEPGEEKKPSGGAESKPAKKPQETERAIDASRLDLRVGKIIDVKKHPDADTLYVEQIECGEERPRTVVSGLVKFVPLEQMQNRMVVILCNLKPAKMRGVLSEAMVMCASTPERVEILSPPEGAVPGDRVSFEKYPGEPDSQLNPKKKIWEQIAPDLKTNDQLEATYKGDRFVVSGKGPVKSETLKNVPVK